MPNRVATLGRAPRRQPRPWQVLLTTLAVAALVAGFVIGLTPSGLTRWVKPPIRTAAEACRWVTEHNGNPPSFVGIVKVLVAPSKNREGWGVQVDAEKVYWYGPWAAGSYTPHRGSKSTWFHAWNGESWRAGVGPWSDVLQNHMPYVTFGSDC